MNSFQQRHKPHKLLAHEALFRRLHSKYRYNDSLQANYQKYRAGYYGEQQVDYKLSLFPRKEFFHLPSLRFKNNNNLFQLDSLILTPKLIFNLEIKNLKGILEYNASHKQLIQIDGETKTSYKDPILQAETQKMHLIHWLRQFDCNIPIESIVVSTNPNAIIRNEENDQTFNERFISLENLIFKLDEIYSSYKQSVLNYREIKSLYNHLVKHDIPLRTDIINFYNLKKHHFIRGIACEICDFFPLNRNRGYWICPKCGERNLVGHERVILDYFLIHQPMITNKIARHLLQTASVNTVYHLLMSMDLERIGGKKNRKYLSPELSEFPQDAVPKLFNISILNG